MKNKSKFNPIQLGIKIITLIKSIPGLIKAICLFNVFFILLLFFLIGKMYEVLTKIPILGHIFIILKKFWDKAIKSRFNFLINKLELAGSAKVKRSFLISLAYKNLMAKKTRSLVSILGMSVGVGIIVLLLSLGYGIERLIISRVASLDELKIIDVSAGENTALRLSREVLKKIQKIQNIEKSIPLVSLVGRVSYNKASTDVLVYAAPNSYLELSRIKLMKGKMFSKNNEYEERKTALESAWSTGEIAGLTTKLTEATLGAKITGNTVLFNIKPETEAIAWEDCSISSKMLGYTARIEGGYSGVEYWGGDYYPFAQKGREAYDKKQDVYLGRWAKAKVPLFEKTVNESLIPVLDEQGRHKWEMLCLQQKNIQILEEFNFGQVLGEATDSASMASATDSASLESATATDSAALTYDTVSISTGSGGLEFVSLQATTSAKTKKEAEIKLEEDFAGEALVSRGFLNLLNISTQKAIGTVFKVKFIITKNLMPEIEGKAFTSEVEYKIIGIVDDPDSSYFYIPFTDVEVLGLKTTSVVDTVKQIEGLFGNLRIVLGILGLVALAVASLGMFNTLTVSLLERIREIGGMKVMGMVSEEVQELFLAEAMIMGLSGGIGGVLLGFLAGQVISLAVSLIAISKGQGYLDLVYLPPQFVIFILVASFIVGVVTGFYPAQKAKKTSALNALRYE